MGLYPFRIKVCIVDDISAAGISHRLGIKPLLAVTDSNRPKMRYRRRHCLARYC